MAYGTIPPPFNLKFDEMSKSELKEYFQWFLGAIPQRLTELADAVRKSPGYEEWWGDYKPASLKALGDWFAAQIETRQRTDEELDKIKSHLKFPIEVSDKELTDRTFLLTMDVGMYLSQVFLINHRSLRWEQPLGSRKFVDYGQPVLVGFGRAPFNPVRTLVSLAYGITSKKRTGKSLVEVYEFWSKLLPHEGGEKPR
jgi:hypothetical protein